MKNFISGLKLSEKTYETVINPILHENYPTLLYSAARLGKGSEILGFDDQMSMDHDWGVKLQLFLRPEDTHLKDELCELFSIVLPDKIEGILTNFSEQGKDGSSVLKKRDKNEMINHGIEITTIQEYYKDFLGIDPYKNLSSIDWLVIPEHRLLSVTSGKVFHDQLDLIDIRNKFSYYPHDVWLFILMSQFKLIAEEEPFVGRTGYISDDIGSRLIASRQVERMMQLVFYLEKKYTPYSKWFGKAFTQLQLSSKLLPILQNVLESKDWKTREKYLSQSYEMVIEEFNKLKLTRYFEPKVKKFWSRPFDVIDAHEISNALKETIQDKQLLQIGRMIGKIDQITNSVDVLDYKDTFSRFRSIYT